jgi:hypothetical protein
MEQSPSWQPKTSQTTQEIPHILWNPKVHHRIHNSPPTVPILSQIDIFYALPFTLSRIHSNIILPSMPRSSNIPWYLKVNPETQISQHILFKHSRIHSTHFSSQQRSDTRLQNRVLRQHQTLFLTPYIAQGLRRPWIKRSEIPNTFTTQGQFLWGHKIRRFYMGSFSFNVHNSFLQIWFIWLAHYFSCCIINHLRMVSMSLVLLQSITRSE